ncbi:hypothetical protein BBJ28_00000660 [Nothophytophthora sp. Chile5]|nr:hypothetical protein BBJ28_00000660 [Nothophytophthora sp. Chile5]
MEPSMSLSAGRTRFVTSLPVLSSEDAAQNSLFRAFVELRARIRSAAWKPSLLVLLGHDPAKCRDEVDRQIREDEAGEAIDGELRVFFESVLAPVMQERETALVNAMHDCFRQELQLQLVITESQEQRVAQLSQQNEQWEKEIGHLKAKIDRRVAENNALRKEQYKQLLILREIMSKQSSEPRALTALNDAIATVMTGNQQTAVQENADSSGDHDQHKAPGRGWMALNTGTQAWRHEKEKWELRAREASVECQELREKLACLEQQLATNRANKSVQWFVKAESAVAERQRIADAVSAAQCSWEDVGDSLAELLNSDILWAAVEQSARRGDKNRLSRGLEAVLVELDSWTQVVDDEAEAKEEDEEVVPPPEVYRRRRSTFAESARLIPCGACSGAGYIRSDLDGDGTNDEYLRKTLAQVLELKTQLEKATSKAMTLEGQLQLSYMQTAQFQDKLEQLECIKANGVDSCLQTDLDDEESIDFNEIMQSAYNQDASQPAPRQGRRNVQYEHLIVELKRSLADKDESLAESRKTLDAAQARVVALQRAIQKEKEAHSHELMMLKSSLAFSLKHRNNKIEERQAAVKLLLKKFSHEQQPPRKRRKAFALMQVDAATIKEDEDDDDETREDGDENGESLETTDPSGRDSDQREVERAEKLVQRYTEDILRVQKEHEDQQNLLKKAEAEIAAEEDKRSRTNSISQGSLVVSMASHPRDLFKALTTAQGETLKLRRASQRSSALQTDRLLTLTTHLGHMSEELCMLRKRNMSELEYWKLECEKLQNTNKALTAEQQLTQQQLQIAHARQTEILVDSSSKLCVVCEKHQSRLMEISQQVLSQAQMKAFSRSDPETEVPARVELTDFDRKNLGCVLLDLEAICSSMSAMKQQLVRSFFASQLGSDLSVNSGRSVPTLTAKAEKMDSSRSPSSTAPTNYQDMSNSTGATTTTDSSPRKSVANVKGLKSKRLLKTSSEATTPALHDAQYQSDNRSHLLIEAPTKANGVDQNVTAATESEGAGRLGNCTSPALHGEQTDIAESLPPAYRKTTLVQEIVDDGELVLTKHGLTVAPAHIHNPVVSFGGRISDNYADGSLDNNAADLDVGNSIQRSSPAIACEPQDLSIHDGPGSSPFARGVNGESIAFMNSNDIERDPEVIAQLQTLIKQSNVAKRGLTIANWEVLMCRIQCLRGQQRLEQVTNDSCRLVSTCKQTTDKVPVVWHLDELREQDACYWQAENGTVWWGTSL